MEDLILMQFAPGKGMAFWKKCVIGLMLVCALTFAALLALLSNGDDRLCGTFVVDEVLSPNRKSKAVSYQIDCGATTGFNTHMAILPGGSTLEIEDRKLWGVTSFFVVESNNDPAPRTQYGGPKVTVQWVSDTKIELHYDARARVIRKALSSGRIQVDYHYY